MLKVYGVMSKRCRPAVFLPSDQIDPCKVVYDFRNSKSLLSVLFKIFSFYPRINFHFFNKCGYKNGSIFGNRAFV